MLNIYPVGDGKHWCLVEEYKHEVGKVSSGLFVTVPDGFVTDLASIPSWLQWLINPFDPKSNTAAVVHDYLLVEQYEQRFAAAEFYRRLTLDGFGKVKKFLFFLAVLAFSRE